MAATSPNPHDPDPLLQRRVALLLGLATSLLAVFLVYEVVEAAVEDAIDRVLTPGLALHGAATVLAAALTAYMRTGERTVRQAYLVDATGMITLALSVAGMSAWAPIGYRPEFTMLTALTLTFVGRSAIVPSTARRTAMLCALAAPPMAWLTWRTYVGYEPPGPGYPAMTSAGVTFYILLWWAAASSIAVIVSNTIYGLRQEVQRARRLGQYALEDKIGEGGMGQVYRARHAMLRRPTALKLLVNASDEQLERFEREVQITAELTHPNTVAIFDYGRTPDGIFYYAMEYLDGVDLEDLVAHFGPQPPARAIHLLRQVCGALGEAHEAGLIHRDVKPANIILCERGGVADVAKVLDFGLVKSVGEDSADAGKTADGAILGTPLYMAPEAIKSPDGVDARSDLYGLGAVAYYLLTGAPVFDGDTVVEVCAGHLHQAPKPLREHVAEIPDDLAAVVLRCLAKAPEDRPQSAEELRDALDDCEAARSWRSGQAQAWWDDHRAEVAEHRGAASVTSATVDIDLSARAAMMRR